ncbi:type II toxin-antitoxin system VapB family antitoxin [Verrucomicrobiaceae bacterium R5-34]|nr:type II toxin-antitoxin system VapB family antitoxin [Verrucomicrobiaceae bacterium R5-34]
MKITITVDDHLFDKAATITGDDDASSIVTKALDLLIATAAKKNILALSASAPDFMIPQR